MEGVHTEKSEAENVEILKKCVAVCCSVLQRKRAQMEGVHTEKSEAETVDILKRVLQCVAVCFIL